MELFKTNKMLITHYMDENGMYIGILPLIFFGIGLIKRGGKEIALLISFIVFLLLGFGLICILGRILYGNVDDPHGLVFGRRVQ